MPKKKHENKIEVIINEIVDGANKLLSKKKDYQRMINHLFNFYYLL